MPGVLDAVGTAVPAHFQDAQQSTATHRKHAVGLFRLHEQCAVLTEETPRGTRLVGEKAFNGVFFRCIDRALAQRKGVKSADCVLKFAAAYVSYSTEQFRAAAQQRAADDDNTPATRFVVLLLKHLLKGFHARDKNVRWRCCAAVAQLINAVEALDDDTYDTLASFLLERLADREAGVRVQAVVALARLQSDEDGVDERTTRLLLHLLRHDASAEVRRAALFNIAPTPATLPHLLERLRDVDAVNRRCVYLVSLRALLDAQPSVEHEGRAVRAGLGLGEAALHEVVRVGLHEREASVRRAARRLVAHWLAAMGGDVLLLLEHLRVTRSGGGEAVVMALLEDDDGVRARVAALLRDMGYWAAPATPERALLARCFVLYAAAHHLDSELDACVPPVTALALRIEAEYTALHALLAQQAAEEEEDAPALADERTLAAEFVVDEMLALAMHCDYGDELGRRRMFMLVREMLGNAWLPASLVPRCLDVLLRLSSGQRDFMQLVVELVQALDESPEDEAELAAADHTLPATPRRGLSWHARVSDAASSPAHAAHRAALDARRLLIVRAMLERVACALQDDAAFHGLIPQLIVPTVRSRDAAVREQGLVCLGLCSLLDLSMALDTFPLLLDQIQRAHGTIRLRCVECLFDLAVVHGVDALCARSAEAAAREMDGDAAAGAAFARQQMLGFVLSLLEHDDADVQAVAAEGIAKLLLTGAVADDDVLKSLVLTYLGPDASAHQPLRQCLSYFLPLFCSSHARHQRMIQRVFCDAFDVLAAVYEDRDAQARMVPLSQMALQLADWCNPERLLLSQADELVHADLAVDVLRHALVHRAQRRALVLLVGKLYLPADLDAPRVQALAALAEALRVRVDEAVSRNALARFLAALEKKYAPVFAAWSPTQGVEDAALRAFLQSLPPAAGGAARPVRRRAKKAVSESESDASDTWDSDASDDRVREGTYEPADTGAGASDDELAM